MTAQPRHGASGRYLATTRSTPEMVVSEETTSAVSDAILTKALENITATFDDLACIAERGREFFFAEDHIGCLAATGALIRLGEQAKRLGPDFIARNPEPGYSMMTKQRDFLAHNFRRVDWEAIWRTVTVAVPRAATAHDSVQQRFLLRAQRLAVPRARPSTRAP